MKEEKEESYDKPLPPLTGWTVVKHEDAGFCDHDTKDLARSVELKTTCMAEVKITEGLTTVLRNINFQPGAPYAGQRDFHHFLADKSKAKLGLTKILVHLICVVEAVILEVVVSQGAVQITPGIMQWYQGYPPNLKDFMAHFWTTSNLSVKYSGFTVTGEKDVIFRAIQEVVSLAELFVTTGIFNNIDCPADILDLPNFN